MSKLDKTPTAVEKGGKSLTDRLLDGFFQLIFAGFCLWGIYAAYTGWELQTKEVTTTGMVERLDERWVFPMIIIPAVSVAALFLNVFAVRAWRRGEPIGE